MQDLSRIAGIEYCYLSLATFGIADKMLADVVANIEMNGICKHFSDMFARGEGRCMDFASLPAFAGGGGLWPRKVIGGFLEDLGCSYLCVAAMAEAAAASELVPVVGQQLRVRRRTKVQVWPEEGKLSSAYEGNEEIRALFRNNKQKLLGWPSPTVVGVASMRALSLNVVAVKIAIEMWATVCPEPKGISVDYLKQVMTAAWGQDAPIEDGGDDRDDAVEDDAYLPLGDADDSFPAQAEHSDAIAADSLDRELSALELRMQELQNDLDSRRASRLHGVADPSNTDTIPPDLWDNYLADTPIEISDSDCENIVLNQEYMQACVSSGRPLAEDEKSQDDPETGGFDIFAYKEDTDEQQEQPAGSGRGRGRGDDPFPKESKRVADEMPEEVETPDKESPPQKKKPKAKAKPGAKAKSSPKPKASPKSKQAPTSKSGDESSSAKTRPKNAGKPKPDESHVDDDCNGNDADKKKRKRHSEDEKSFARRAKPKTTKALAHWAAIRDVFNSDIALKLKHPGSKQDDFWAIAKPKMPEKNTCTYEDCVKVAKKAARELDDATWPVIRGPVWGPAG
ncbi:hypothetical protein AK812_SmicGene15397 [Symbiodinium microadriaticum]|uniref:Uncharacterized protein n=1 Tax=Symbiodinium microadriaticum TaxID=2951 RepID=A0A1Q9E307_SYMMI|nr:hypothetical protein AK812_SmicGene15397 [Symbiodinium microadriaticum]